MYFISTRSEERCSFKDAFMRGRCSRGGVFLPESLPPVDADFLERISGLPFAVQAAEIMKLLLPELAADECELIAADAFSEENFGREAMVCRPLNPYIKEELILFAERGRSGHVEDYASALTDAMLRKWAGEEESVYLISNGSPASARSLAAAVSGLSNWKPLLLIGSKQEKQSESEWEDLLKLSGGIGIRMEEKSINAEKALFALGADFAWREELSRQGIHLLYADECQVASWLAHLILLISSFASLKAQEIPEEDANIDLSVPVSGLGFILAALYGKGMGLPIGKIIGNCSKNHPFSEFIRSGRYSLREKRGRDALPEADERFLPASLEALLFELSGRNGSQVAAWLSELEEKDGFSCAKSLQQSWKQHVTAFYSDGRQTEREARQIYDRTDYLLDIGACMAYVGRDAESGGRNQRQTVLILSGQNPYWTESFAAAAIFSRASVSGKASEPLRRLVAEEAGLTVPGLQQRIAAAGEESDEHPYQPCGAENLKECVYDLLRSDRRINH